MVRQNPNKSELKAEIDRLKKRIQQLESEAGRYSQQTGIGQFTEQLIAGMTDGFSVLDKHSRHVLVNDALCRMTGFSREELLNAGPPHPYWPEEEYQTIQATFQQILQGSTDEHELIFCTRSGKRFPVLVSPASLKDGQGETLYYFATVKDISNRKASEEALRESEKKYRNLTEAAIDAIVCFDEEERITVWNHAAVELFGYSPEEALGHKLHELLAPSRFREQINRGLREFFKKGTGRFVGQVSEVSARHKDGREIPVELSVSGLETLSGWQATAIIRNAAGIRKSESRLKVLSQAVEQSPAMVMITDADARIEYVNRKFTEVTGYSLAVIKGKNLRLMNYGDTPPEKYRQPWPTIANQEAWKGRVPNKKKNGEFFWEDAYIGPITDEKGKIIKYIALKEDVSERVEVEEALRRSEERFRMAFEQSSVGMALVSIHGKFLKTNHSLSQILGYSAEELSRLSFQDITHPDDVEKDLEHLRKMLEGRIQTYRTGKRYFHKNGNVVWVSLNTTLVRDEEGKPDYFVSQLQDVTDRKLAEEALKENQQKLQALFDTTEDFLFILDEKGCILQVNPVVERRLGYSAQELLGQPVFMVHPKSMQEEAVRVINRMLKGELDLCTIPLQNREGELIPVDTRVSRAKWKNQEVLFGISRDISRRVSVEQELRKLSRAVEQSPVSVIITDRDGAIEYVNPNFTRTTGYTLEDVRGQNPRLFKSGRTSPEEYKHLWETIRSGGTWRGEFYNRKKNGELVREEVSIGPITNEAGEITHYVSLRENVTEQRKAAEEMKILAHALKSVRECVSVTDLNDNILFVNDAFEKTYGYTGEELIGKSITLLHSPNTPRELLEEIRPATLRGGWQGEVINRRKDGSEFPVFVSTSVIQDDDNQPIALMGVATDITESKKLEEQFRHAQKMEAVGRLAGGVAHDFNNLLTIIRGYSELILSRMKPEDPSYKKIQQIDHAGERAEALTRQLLAFSRRQVLQPKILDLNALIRDVEKMLKRLIGEDVEMKTVLDDELGHIKADPGQIEQVIMNLVVNARDAMPGGGYLTIETQNASLSEDYLQDHRGKTPGNYIMLEISDTGHGMDRETQSQIFEPFFTTKEKGKGTGLGLATVYGIVKQSNGFIWVYSELNRGTTFKIYLPRVDEAPGTYQPRRLSTENLEGNETILVVEDEYSVRQLISETLKSYGYQVIDASDGKKALEIARKHSGRIDAVISDVVMPQMSGMQLKEELTQIFPSLKIIFVSGYTERAFLRSGELEPGMHYLQKPFNSADLARMLRRVLEDKNG